MSLPIRYRPLAADTDLAAMSRLESRGIEVHPAGSTLELIMHDGHPTWFDEYLVAGMAAGARTRLHCIRGEAAAAVLVFDRLTDGSGAPEDPFAAALDRPPSGGPVFLVATNSAGLHRTICAALGDAPEIEVSPRPASSLTPGGSGSAPSPTTDPPRGPSA